MEGGGGLMRVGGGAGELGGFGWGCLFSQLRHLGPDLGDSSFSRSTMAWNLSF